MKTAMFFYKQALMAICLLATVGWLYAKPVIKAGCDHSNLQYKLGEEPVFEFSVTEDGKPLQKGTATLQVDMDGGRVLHKETFSLAEQSAANIKIDKFTLTEPGFLRVSLKVADDEKKVRSNNIVSVAFETEKIRTAEPCPADFSNWWQEQIKKAEMIPLDAKLEKLAQYSDDRFTGYKVSFAAPGGRVWGFLTVPVTPGTYPAVIKVPGAGPGIDRPLPGKSGLIQLAMNVHNFDPLIPNKTIRQSYLDADKKYQRGYSYVNKDDRNTYFFHRAILGIYRAVNYLASRDDVKKNAIGIYGFSQGGAMTLIIAGLNPKICHAVANMPAMCDLFSTKKGRGASWPYTLSAYKCTTGSQMTARYYDAANFARGIKCPIAVFVGALDDTSRPSTIYAAFNNIPSIEKSITLLNARHSESKAYFDAVKKMEEILKKR